MQKDLRDDTHCCILGRMSLVSAIMQWRRQDFVTGGEVRCGSIGGLEYEVPQSRLYCLCINVALCSTALQCICHVKRRSSMTMKAHTYYIIFGRPPIGGSFPLATPLLSCVHEHNLRCIAYKTIRTIVSRECVVVGVIFILHLTALSIEHRRHSTEYNLGSILNTRVPSRGILVNSQHFNAAI